MDDPEISYLLRRCSAHRALARVATCAESHCIHQEFVRRYQHRLLGLRRTRAMAMPTRQELMAA
jgi:hypothetical protein